MPEGELRARSLLLLAVCALVGGGLVACVGLLALLLVRAPAGAPQWTPGEPLQPRAVTRGLPLPARAEGDLDLLVVDGAGEPLGGLEVALVARSRGVDGWELSEPLARGVSDRDGEVLLRYERGDRWGWLTVDAPWRALNRESVPLTEDLRWLLVVVEIGHVEVEVVDEDGAPVPGGRVYLGTGSTAYVDEEGRASLNAPCDRGDADYRPSRTQRRWYDVLEERDLGGGRLLLVLGDDGEPAEPHGPRTVTVHLSCEQCPDQVVCGRSFAPGACTGSLDAPTCSCPPWDAVLWGRTTEAWFDWRMLEEALAAVRADVDELDVEVPDLRASVVVR